MLHEQEVASAVDPGWLLSTVISGAGRYEPVHDDQIVVAQLRDERLKKVLDAEASLEVLRPRLQLRSYSQPWRQRSCPAACVQTIVLGS